MGFPLLIRFALTKTKRIFSKIHPWGFFGLSLWDVGERFFNGLSKGVLSLKASAIAFDFFLAMFPGIIFIFSLIPFLPIQNYQDQLLTFLAGTMPQPAFELLESTIVDIISTQRRSLLSFGILASLYFATSGFSTMITAFNETVNSIEKRPWWSQKLVSLLLVVLLFVFVTIAIILTTASSHVFDFLVAHRILQVGFTYYLLIFGKWIITISLIYFSIASIYYLAPAKKSNFHFFSPGAILATLLTILMMIGFSYYINNFGRYNALYGSLGTLIILLVWVRLNSYIILIGFELNASVFGKLSGMDEKKITA